jgi:hypothetical protein
VGGGVLNSPDEAGGVLKMKVLRSGTALKKFNIWYLSPTRLPAPRYKKLKNSNYLMGDKGLLTR